MKCGDEGEDASVLRVSSRAWPGETRLCLSKFAPHGLDSLHTDVLIKHGAVDSWWCEALTRPTLCQGQEVADSVLIGLAGPFMRAWALE